MFGCVNVSTLSMGNGVFGLKGDAGEELRTTESEKICKSSAVVSRSDGLSDDDISSSMVIEDPADPIMGLSRSRGCLKYCCCCC